MRQTLYSKFITAYIFLGILGTVLISTLGSSLIQKHILEDTGAALYKEAISLASYQANTDYSDNADVEAAYNQLKTLSAFQDSRILILNPSGQPLIDTGNHTLQWHKARLKTLILRSWDQTVILQVLFMDILRKIWSAHWFLSRKT